MKPGTYKNKQDLQYSIDKRQGYRERQESIIGFNDLKQIKRTDTCKREPMQ